MYLIIYSQQQEVRLYGGGQRENVISESYTGLSINTLMKHHSGGKPLHHIAGAKPGVQVKIPLVVFDAPCAREGTVAQKQEREKGKSVCWGGKKRK